MPIVSTVSIRREAADRAARSSPRPAPDLRSTRCLPTRPSHLVYETSAGDVRVAVGQVARGSVRADAAGARCSRASRGTCEAFADDVSESASRVQSRKTRGICSVLVRDLFVHYAGGGSRIASGRPSDRPKIRRQGRVGEPKDFRLSSPFGGDSRDATPANLLLTGRFQTTVLASKVARFREASVRAHSAGLP
jgi:hypothetical protein